MKNKVLLMIIGILVFSCGANAALVTSNTVFQDDFQAYPTSDPADFSATGNWTWNGNGTAPNASRIFSTGNYGGTKLWIASAANATAGTGINSLATIPVVAGTNYTFRGAIVCETNLQTRTASFTVDLLVGGVSQIDGPIAGTAQGDDTIPDSYDDQWTIIHFTPTATGNLEIKIAFTGTDTSNPFVGIDEVSIAEPLVIGVDESDGSTDVTEGVGSDTYDLVLLGDPNYPTSPVTVTLTPDTQVEITNASSIGSNVLWDLASVPQTVTFPASSTDPNDYTVTLTVEAVNDTDIEGDHTGTITHTCSSADLRWNAKPCAGTIVNVQDDDGTPEIISDAAPLWVGEGNDPNDSYTLVLGKPPATGTTVTVTVDGGTQLNPVPSSVVFTPANWSVPQTVIIEAVNDAVVEGTHFGTVSHTVASGDPAYSDLTVPSVPAAIGDNDAMGPAGIGATPAVWYNEDSMVSRENGAAAADGEEITLWEDQSGNRRYARGKDYYGNDNPRYDADTNSADFALPSAILAGDNFPEGGFAQPTTIFCVGSIRSLPYTGYFYDSLNGSSRQILTAHGGGTWQVGAGAWPNTSEWYLGAPVINTIVFNSTSSQQRVNGEVVFTGDMGTGALDGLVLGCRYNTANHLDGQISEFILYDSELSTADMEAVEEYLIGKWTGRIGFYETNGDTEVNEVVDPNTDTYSVLVYGAPTSTVDLTITPTGDNAGDVDLGSGAGAAYTLNLPAEATSTLAEAAIVTVASVDNTTSDGPRQVPLAHTSVSADADYDAQVIDDVIVTVNDNEAWCGQDGTVYYAADLNQDCYVTLEDFAVLAGQWLDCTNPGDSACD